MKTITNPSFGAQIAGLDGQMGICLSAHNGEVLNLLNNFIYQIQIKRWQFYEKYSRHKYLGPHTAGCFEKFTVCQLAENGLVFLILKQFIEQIPTERGSFLGENASLCI